jgi:hypothetical protein
MTRRQDRNGYQPCGQKSILAPGNACATASPIDIIRRNSKYTDGR